MPQSWSLKATTSIIIHQSSFMINKNWWKYLGAVILLYVLTVGMLVPLKPGISDVNPSSVRTGETVTFKVWGYNSNFSKAEEPTRAWLKLNDEQALSARRVTIMSDTMLEVEFTIPEYLPVAQKVQDFSLILDNDVDGPSVLPSAVFVTQDSVDAASGERVWTNDPVKDLHNVSGMTFPFRNILGETIRNTYFHVALWLAMFTIFIAGVYQSVRYLRSKDPARDNWAVSYTTIGVLLGLLGVLTGAIWAKNTWGAYWSWDVKQNTTAIALLIYLAYFVLRASFEDPEQQARISAVYNIFAFAALIPLIYVIPRLTDSLHPGAGGNITFGSQDLDNTMRMVFYPAVIGWTLLGVWMATLLFRVRRLQERLYE
jgi:heme exporter protein C